MAKRAQYKIEADRILAGLREGYELRKVSSAWSHGRSGLWMRLLNEDGKTIDHFHVGRRAWLYLRDSGQIQQDGMSNYGESDGANWILTP